MGQLISERQPVVLVQAPMHVDNDILLNLTFHPAAAADMRARI